jgi:hypothetical protein
MRTFLSLPLTAAFQLPTASISTANAPGSPIPPIDRKAPRISLLRLVASRLFRLPSPRLSILQRT